MFSYASGWRRMRRRRRWVWSSVWSTSWCSHSQSCMSAMVRPYKPTFVSFPSSNGPKWSLLAPVDLMKYGPQLSTMRFIRLELKVTVILHWSIVLATKQSTSVRKFHKRDNYYWAQRPTATTLPGQWVLSGHSNAHNYVFRVFGGYALLRSDPSPKFRRHSDIALSSDFALCTS